MCVYIYIYIYTYMYIYIYISMHRYTYTAKKRHMIDTCKVSFFWCLTRFFPRLSSIFPWLSSIFPWICSIFPGHSDESASSFPAKACQRLLVCDEGRKKERKKESDSRCWPQRTQDNRRFAVAVFSPRQSLPNAFSVWCKRGVARVYSPPCPWDTHYHFSIKKSTLRLKERECPWDTHYQLGISIKTLPSKKVIWASKNNPLRTKGVQPVATRRGVKRYVIEWWNTHVSSPSQENFCVESVTGVVDEINHKIISIFNRPSKIDRNSP